MPRLNALITVLLVLTVAIGNGSSTFPTEALLAKLYQLQTRDSNKKRQDSGSDSNGTGISLDSFPPVCRPGCTPAIDAWNTCSTLSCLCTADIDKSVQFCIACSITTSPDEGTIEAAQGVINRYNGLCKGLGVATLTRPSGIPSPSVASDPYPKYLNSLTTPTPTSSTGVTGTTGPMRTNNGSSGIGSSTPSSNVAMASTPNASVGYVMMGLFIALCTTFIA